MRTRDLKPAFFRNPVLGRLPYQTRLLFAGLWCMADKRGRLVDEPALIKADVFPYDNINVGKLLTQLETCGFIKRYEALGIHCIWITKFDKHQNPHPKEPESVLPPAVEEPCTGNVEETEEPLLLRGEAV